MRTANKDEEEKVNAALNRAVEALESTLRDQEAAVVRILGLAERLFDNTKDGPTRLQIEAIMEACTFQDITGQRIQKVVRLIKFLRDNGIVESKDMALPEVIRKQGLSQEEVNRLLAGGKPVVKA